MNPYELTQQTKSSKVVEAPKNGEIQEAMTRLLGRIEYAQELLCELERRLIPCLSEPEPTNPAPAPASADSMFAGTLNVGTAQMEVQISQLNSLLTRLRL